MDSNKAILSMLTEILGDPLRSNEDKQQYAFNCPICDEGRNKGNFEVNLHSQIFHCWSCDDSDETKGNLFNFFRRFGNERYVKQYILHRPTHKTKIEKKYKNVVLPEGFIKFADIILDYPPHKQAYNYLKNRGISDDLIEKYSIGLTTKGFFANRIVFPSYDKNGKLNFFVTRTWTDAKPKYLNCDHPKDNIIFNEHLINWNEPIYITEGVIDGIFAGNSLVTLGCDIYTLVRKTIYENAKSDIIIAYDGDMWNNKRKIKEAYHTINAGKLYGRVKALHLPEDEDVASLKGDILKYIEEIR